MQVKAECGTLRHILHSFYITDVFGLSVQVNFAHQKLNSMEKLIQSQLYVALELWLFWQTRNK